MITQQPEAPVEPDLTRERATPGLRWRWIVGFAVSAFFLWIAFRQVGDLRHLADALGSASYGWLIPAVGLYLVGLWVRAVRWRILMMPVAPLPITSLYGILSIGFLVNNILPARLGEIARAFLIGRRHGVSRSAALATIVVERIFDGIVMLLFLGIATAAAGGQVAPDWLTLLVPITAIAFGGATIVLALLALAPTMALRMAAVLMAPLPVRAREAALEIGGKFIVGLGVLQDLKLAAGVLVTSVLAWLVEAQVYAAVGRAFGLAIDPVAFLLALAVANLGTMIPSSPGYVGTFDALVARSLAIFALSDAVALAYALVLHLTIWLPPTLIGLFFLWRYSRVTPISLRDLTSSADRSPSEKA